MKYLVSVAVLLIAGIFMAAPALAFDPPAQGTDNATDVVIWHGDSQNITLSSDDLNTAITGIGTTLDTTITNAVSDMLGNLVILIIIFALAYLGYRFDQRLLFFSGLAALVYGYSYSSTSTYYSIIIVLAGIFFIASAFKTRKKVV